MGKTILRFYDTAGYPLLDSVNVSLSGPIGGSVVDTLGTVYGTNQGMRIFSSLTNGDYNVSFNGVQESLLSPMFIAGPVIATYVPSPGSIDATALASDSVTTPKIQDGAVDSDKLDTNSVITSKILDSAVSGDKIQNASIGLSKMAAGVFNSSMENVGGYGPKVDDDSIGFNISGELEVKDGSIDATKLKSSVDFSSKVANNSLSGAKLQDLTITETKLGNGIVSASKLASSAVTEDKVADDSISYEKLKSSTIVLLREGISGIPSLIAYVSPNYVDSGSPYFSSIQDAVDWMEEEDLEGSIEINPGIYLENITINSSISLLGKDKNRCLIQHIPTSGAESAIKLIGSGSKQTNINNLTINCLSDNAQLVDAYGIESTYLGNLLRIENCLIKVRAASGVTGFYGWGICYDGSISSGRILIDGCDINVIGGSSSTGYGRDAFGIGMSCRTFLSLYRTNIKARGGTGQSTGYGGQSYDIYKFGNDVYWIPPPDELANGGQINIALSILDSVNDAIKNGVSAHTTNYVTAMSTAYKGAIDETAIPLTSFINSAQDSAVSIKSNEVF